MASRDIMKQGEEVLRKVARPVTTINQRIVTLLEDMAQTMHEADGVGLAANQVGVLRRVVVIDVGDGLIELINPEIIKREGEQIGMEGCLSCPGQSGYVSRPAEVTIRALDRNGTSFEMEGTGMLARAFCHEIDHLDGKLFVELVMTPEQLHEAGFVPEVDEEDEMDEDAETDDGADEEVEILN